MLKSSRVHFMSQIQLRVPLLKSTSRQDSVFLQIPGGFIVNYCQCTNQHVDEHTAGTWQHHTTWPQWVVARLPSNSTWWRTKIWAVRVKNAWLFYFQGISGLTLSIGEVSLFKITYCVDLYPAHTEKTKDYPVAFSLLGMFPSILRKDLMYFKLFNIWGSRNHESVLKLELTRLIISNKIHRCSFSSHGRVMFITLHVPALSQCKHTSDSMGSHYLKVRSIWLMHLDYWL
jgi:hypothetical protein